MRKLPIFLFVISLITPSLARSIVPAYTYVKSIVNSSPSFQLLEYNADTSAYNPIVPKKAAFNPDKIVIDASFSGSANLSVFLRKQGQERLLIEMPLASLREKELATDSYTSMQWFNFPKDELYRSLAGKTYKELYYSDPRQEYSLYIMEGAELVFKLDEKIVKEYLMGYQESQ